MLQYLNALGLVIYVWVVVLDLAFHYHQPDWYETWDFYIGPVHCLSACLVSLVNFMLGFWYFGILYAGLAAVGAWLWWNNTNNRRRRRRLKKRAARIAEVNGRLTIQQPEPEG